MTDYSNLFIKAKKTTKKKLNLDEIVEFVFEEFLDVMEARIPHCPDTTETYTIIQLSTSYVAEDSVNHPLIKYLVLEKIRNTLPPFVKADLIESMNAVRLDWSEAPDQ
jgi:hypothetical protein